MHMACSHARVPTGPWRARVQTQFLLGILPRPSRVTEPLLVEPKDVSPRERHQHQTVPVEYHRKLRPVPPARVSMARLNGGPLQRSTFSRRKLQKLQGA